MATRDRCKNLIDELSGDAVLSLESVVDIEPFHGAVEVDLALEQMASLESLVKVVKDSGKCNRATAMLIYHSLESCGAEIPEVTEDGRSVAELNDVEMHDLAMEGIGKFIGDKMQKIKEWWEKKTQDASMREGKLVANSNDIMKMIRRLETEVSNLPNDTKISVPLARNAAMFSMAGSIPNNLPAALASDQKFSLDFMTKARTQTQAALALVQSITSGMDVSSDQAFEKTFLQQLGKLKGHFLSNQLGNKPHDFFDGFTLMPDPAVVDFEKSDALGKMGALQRMASSKVSQHNPYKGVEPNVSLSKADLAAILKVGADYLEEIVSGKSSGPSEVRIQDGLFDQQYLLYVIEYQYSRNAKHISGLQKHKATLKTLQELVLPFLTYIRLIFIVRGLRANLALACAQLTRRALSEAKR